ncbi:hypothetical protein [Streptomyces sp. UNOC14_S4]|uniref:hypothetical protein n=1 Tax=Streptomyces sp. UNOC14_S4 TaxID=2872340 RepID=UPI001E5C44D2|nr:hypothetical protein [Streptomyces sp. UNOC14_S4]MCC3767848.1 hypothetical protein [Streptomyces sp. UNOC14_S4]
MTGDSPRARIIIIDLNENDTTDIHALIREIALERSTAVVIKGGVQMSDNTYNISGQAGAVGPDARADHNIFNQQQQNGFTLDLPALATELASLRMAMKAEATAPEHDATVGAVAQAEVAAKKGDKAGTLAALKSSGEWALIMARKIGTEIAALAIAHAVAGG